MPVNIKRMENEQRKNVDENGTTEETKQLDNAITYGNTMTPPQTPLLRSLNRYNNLKILHRPQSHGPQGKIKQNVMLCRKRKIFLKFGHLARHMQPIREENVLL